MKIFYGEREGNIMILSLSSKEFWFMPCYFPLTIRSNCLKFSLERMKERTRYWNFGQKVISTVQFKISLLMTLKIMVITTVCLFSKIMSAIILRPLNYSAAVWIILMHAVSFQINIDLII